MHRHKRFVLNAPNMFCVTRSFCTMLVLNAALALSMSATANDSSVTARITGISADEGTINCALFDSADGFPMDSANALTQVFAATTPAAECHFQQLSAGQYAIAISHDRNGNGKTDTNFLGIPKEDWGVSNNARPRMRAPTFEEAAFIVPEGESVIIEIGIK